jgi:hypothetical protein
MGKLVAREPAEYVPRRYALRQQYVGPALRVIMWAFVWAAAYGARSGRLRAWD